MLAGLVGGCGTVGPPIPPEQVGVAPLIEQQDKLRAQQAGKQAPPLDSTQTEAPQLTEPLGQDEDLPPLHPIGGR
jgi:hypothetical protein